MRSRLSRGAGNGRRRSDVAMAVRKSRHRLYSVFNGLLPAIGEGAQLSGKGVTVEE